MRTSVGVLSREQRRLALSKLAKKVVEVALVRSKIRLAARVGITFENAYDMIYDIYMIIIQLLKLQL